VVDAGGVSGNVYWTINEGTPTDTPTPVPYCTLNSRLYGTGVMSGKTQQWNSFTNISVFSNTSDSVCDPCPGDAYTNVRTTNQKSYSEFPDVTPVPNSQICDVSLKIKSNCWLCSADLGFNFTNDSGTHWANTGTNTWSGTAANAVATYTVPAVVMDVEVAIPITSLYDNWDWAKVNSLGFMINGGYNYKYLGGGNVERVTLDYVRIDVSYYVGPPPPTFTPTPVKSATPSAYPCAYNAVVSSMDSLSHPYTTSGSNCHYEVMNIDSSSGYTSIMAFKERDLDGSSYFKREDNVTVTAGTVTYKDIILEPSSNTPAIFGVVRNAVTNAAIPGAKVMLDDPAESNTVTTGGGVFFLMPVTEGIYTLKAALPGYKLMNPVQKNWGKGIIKAPEDLLLQPIGSISGNVTTEGSGSPVSGTVINVKDPAGNIAGYGRTDATGYFLIEDVFEGKNYRIEPAIDPDITKITFPFAGYYQNVEVKTGFTAQNKDFKVQDVYGTIKGSIDISDSAGLRDAEGATVLVYPSNMPVNAHALDFAMTNSDPDKKGHNGHAKMESPYYGTTSGYNGSFIVSVPLGQTYDVYSFYSYISYTGKAKKPIKTLKKHYAKQTGVSPNSTDVLLVIPLDGSTSY
jgi:hypothetical protein